MKRMFGVDVSSLAPDDRHRLMPASQDVEAITVDGAPSGRKDFMIWSPPLVDEQDPSLGHKSALTEAVRLARFLMERGIRLIVFCTVSSILSLITSDAEYLLSDSEVV